MKYLMSWKFRLEGTATENEETLRRGLAVFSKWSPPQHTTFHQFLSRVDGKGGCAVVETDDEADLLDSVSKFLFLCDYEIAPVVDMDESIRAWQHGLEFLESVT